MQVGHKIRLVGAQCGRVYRNVEIHNSPHYVKKIAHYLFALHILYMNNMYTSTVVIISVVLVDVRVQSSVNNNESLPSCNATSQV